ncbi:MAG: glycoside hydrolase family 25 protein [Flavisolibacter sp.]|nr:glycoside hydrolase family 25 protein [Flavisolibacter sp.]
MPAKKKKSLLKIFVLISVLGAAIFLGLLFLLWRESREPEFIRYPEFGIPIPSPYQIHGIDVSKYQQQIGWESVRDMQVKNIRLGFAFMKATEGLNLSDAYFKRNWSRAKKTGITRGAYHFFIASKDGKAQAKHFISKVKLESGDLPPVLDVEQAGRVTSEKLRKEVKAWLDAVELYYGVKPIIYTGADFYKQHLAGYFDEYPLWVAHYLQPHRPRISRSWSFWQHSESGRVNGIQSKVDFNVFNGDSAAFRSLLVP